VTQRFIEPAGSRARNGPTRSPRDASTQDRQRNSTADDRYDSGGKHSNSAKAPTRSTSPRSTAAAASRRQAAADFEVDGHDRVVEPGPASPEEVVGVPSAPIRPPQTVAKLTMQPGRQTTLDFRGSEAFALKRLRPLLEGSPGDEAGARRHRRSGVPSRVLAR
jgi:hypothetical protein